MRDADRTNALLDWYDTNAREMPWRVGPAARCDGTAPDPYHVWLSEIMLQQTTVVVVRDYFTRFLADWPTVGELANAQDDAVMAAWAGLGYYARARNLLKCARIVTTQYGGAFPATRAELLSLPGIGPYTAAAIMAIAFDIPETVVDGNVERVMARLFAVQTPLPAAKPELTRLAERLTPRKRPGDHAQAVMDLGATVCTPRRPSCGLCPLAGACAARRSGEAQILPRKLPKKPKPTRHGFLYMARRPDGAWLLERRPDSGLLGGMLGWPVSDWSETPTDDPPLAANWSDPGIELRHTFTHFHLRLALRQALVPQAAVPRRGMFLEPATFRVSDFPTLMRKAYRLGAPQMQAIEKAGGLA